MVNYYGQECHNENECHNANKYEPSLYLFYSRLFQFIGEVSLSEPTQFSYHCSVSLKAVQVWCCNLSNIAPTRCHITSTCMIFTAISCLIYYTVCACIAINLSCIITVHNIFLRYCNSHVLINSTHQRSFILNKSSSHINSY